MKSCIAVKNRNCTFLYPSTSRHIRFYLYIRQLQDCKALPHEFFTNFETDALKRLIASDDCIPLNKEHEQMYAERASHGDSKARTELITHNMRLVESIAKHYQGQGFVLDDLVGYGNEGLIKAVDSYDCSRGCGFASYAQYWIKSFH